MKKMFLVLSAVVAMAMAFVSCENPDDPTVYCWEVTFEYVDILTGLTQTEDIDRAMTVAQKNAMLENGYLGQKVIKIVKQENSECKKIDLD